MPETRTTSYIDNKGAKQTGVTTTGGVYRVQNNGQAPKGLTAGDQVVTGGGTYRIDGVNDDGSYISSLVNKKQNTGNYGGSYSDASVGSYLNAAKNQVVSGYGEQQALAQRGAESAQGLLTSGQERLDSGYSGQQSAINAIAEAKTKQITQQMERAREKQAAQYAAANRQLYQDTMQERRTLPEQLAAIGYNGGASESALLRNQLSYEQALRSNESDRISGERDIDLAIQQAALEQEIARQQQLLQLEGDYTSNSLNLLGQRVAQTNTDTGTQLGLMSNRDNNLLTTYSGMQAQRNYLQEREIAAAQYADQYRQQMYTNLVGLISNTGYSPSAEELSAAGMTAAEAAAWQGYYANSFNGGSGGSGSGSGGRRRSGGGSGSYSSEAAAGSQTTEARDNQTAMVNGIRQMMINGASRDAVSAKISSAYESGIINTSAATTLGVENRSRSYAGAARGEKAAK